MEVLPNCLAWKAIKSLAVSVQKRKMRLGLSIQKKCSDFMAEHWSPKKAAWWVTPASRAMETVSRKGLSNMPFQIVFYKILCCNALLLCLKT